MSVALYPKRWLLLCHCTSDLRHNESPMIIELLICKEREVPLLINCHSLAIFGRKTVHLMFPLTKIYICENWPQYLENHLVRFFPELKTKSRKLSTDLANMWIKFVAPIMLSAVSKAEFPAEKMKRKTSLNLDHTKILQLLHMKTLKSIAQMYFTR